MLLVFSIFSVLLAGCGGSVGAPCSVAGEVTYNGEPVADGAIRLDPLEGTHNRVGKAKIVDGEYAIPREQGLVAGKYLVSITATRKTGREVRAAESLEGEPETVAEEVQYIPERYNVDSELEVDLQPGENQKKFSLEGP